MYSLLSLLGKRKGGRERREKKGDLSVTAVEAQRLKVTEWNYFSMKLAHRLACKMQLASKDMVSFEMGALQQTRQCRVWQLEGKCPRI